MSWHYSALSRRALQHTEDSSGSAAPKWRRGHQCLKGFHFIWDTIRGGIREIDSIFNGMVSPFFFLHIRGTGDSFLPTGNKKLPQGRYAAPRGKGPAAFRHCAPHEGYRGGLQTILMVPKTLIPRGRGAVRLGTGSRLENPVGQFYIPTFPKAIFNTLMGALAGGGTQTCAAGTAKPQSLSLIGGGTLSSHPPHNAPGGAGGDIRFTNAAPSKKSRVALRKDFFSSRAFLRSRGLTPRLLRAAPFFSLLSHINRP